MEPQIEETDGKSVVLGEELEVPYTVENMQRAFDNLLFNLKSKSKHSKLAKTFKDEEGIEVLPSHYYYRFLPKDSLEHDLLVKDTILQVSNIPLHYEIEEEGDFYDDPELEGDETPDGLSYLYAVVPYDYPLPETIEKERLDDMYFAPELDKEEPEEGEIVVKQPLNKTTKDILTVDENGEVFEYLELEALKLTNNLEEDELVVLQFYLPNDPTGTLYSYEEASQLGYQQKELIIDLASVEALLEQEALANRRKWHPSGKITVREDVVNRTVGVMGAEVKVRKWGFLVIRRARTDRNGNFRTRRTRTKRVKYAVHFNSNSRKFRIMAGSIFVRAKHRGTRKYKRASWNQHFSYGRSKFYALVHNAAYDFYDRAVGKFGMHHPNQSWLRISARYNGNISDSRHSDLNVNGSLPWIPLLRWKSEIQVGRLNKGQYKASDLVYGAVIHEMTHASHYRMDRSFFINPRAAGCTLQTMAESWAVGVETVVTNDRYFKLNPNYKASNRIGNSRPLDLYNSFKQNEIIKSGSKEEYTPIVIDLIDNYNQKVELNDSSLPIDCVNGYSLKQIQTSLNNVRGPHSWKENLIKQHQNPTEGFVEELFNVYMYDNCD
ncbi:hypothetical protein [Muricauda sp. MAR_2010_75]|uniref:hypothetical protein n=1 Tax=Allomuricauda sp. MAR_2010_75 TaxID=1250232 RepID=UPI0005607462|nr:hypothetical protein [Muricauda sp. MAR_2010_75]